MSTRPRTSARDRAHSLSTPGGEAAFFAVETPANAEPQRQEGEREAVLDALLHDSPADPPLSSEPSPSTTAFDSVVDSAQESGVESSSPASSPPSQEADAAPDASLPAAVAQPSIPPVQPVATSAAAATASQPASPAPAEPQPAPVAPSGPDSTTTTQAAAPAASSSPTGKIVRVGAEVRRDTSKWYRSLGEQERTGNDDDIGGIFFHSVVLEAVRELEPDIDVRMISRGDRDDAVARVKAALRGLSANS